MWKEKEDNPLNHAILRFYASQKKLAYESNSFIAALNILHENNMRVSSRLPTFAYTHFFIGVMASTKNRQTEEKLS